MSRFYRFAQALLLLSLFPAPLLSASDLVPLEYFAKLPAFSSPKISPDGRRMASTIVVEGKPLVVVQPIPSNGKMLREKPAALSVGDLFVSDYEWVSNERLILTIRDAVKDGSSAFRGRLLNLERLLSIRHDATEPINFHMSSSYIGIWEILKPNPKVVSALPDDPDHALVILDDQEGRWFMPIVHKVNVNTGQRKRILGNYASVEDYIGDHQGNIRIGLNTGFRNTDWDLYHRRDNDSAWEKLQSVSYFDRDRIYPVEISKEDPNILIVELPNSLEAPDEDDRLAGRLTQYSYDLTQKKITGLYIDQTWERVKKMVEKKFPQLLVTEESHSLDKSAYIVRTHSDTSPPKYFLIDLNNNGIVRLGQSYPQLESTELARMESVEYQARDERTIPAFLTRPTRTTSEAPLPTVIYPHGGPFAQDFWGFDNYAQFFASRGYVVLQPQFRGSTGHGAEHMEAGYKEFGAAIQDDITDGVKWLIEQGISDPQRICIVGSSFGGYAALIGLIRTPELFQCAVSINGVANRVEQSAGNLISAVYRAVSNEGKDLHKHSPYHEAEHINDAVLLMAGTKDTVVNYRQSKSLYKKIKKLKNASVKYVELKNAEHWRTDEATEIRKLNEIEQFLREHLQ